MEKHSVKAVLIKQTKNFVRYEIKGDCMGTIYVPREIEAPVIELELIPRLSETGAEN
jgi:hypothetical protein